MIARPFRALLVTQLLTGLNLNAFVVRKKRVKAWFATIGLMACLLPSYVGIVTMQVMAFGFLHRHGLPLQDLLLTGLYGASQIVILLSSLPIVYSALYQSRELSILLPLPYRPWQILTAKLAVIYVPELLVGWAFFLPGFISYCAYGYASPWLVPLNLAGLVFMPVIPLALTTLAGMLVANIPGIGRSRWFWYIGITVAILAVSLLPMMSMSADDPQAISDLVQVRMRQISHLVRLLPGVQCAMYSLVDQSWHLLFHQTAYLAVVAAYIAVTLAVGSRLYIGPILRGESAARRHSRVQEPAQVHARGFLLSAVRKELICTLKDPAVAMNGLGGYIALPILALTYTVMKYQTRGKVDIIGQLDHLLHSEVFSRFLPFFVVGIGLGLAAFGSMSSLFAASYSKDGKRLWIEKTLPVHPFTILLSKLLAGFMIVSLLNLATVAVFSLVVPFRATDWVLAILISELFLAWTGTAGLAIDCVRPKLVWKDTVQAVKQNMNVVLALGVGMAGLGVNVLVLRLLYLASAPPMAVYIAAIGLNAVFLAGSLTAARAASARFVKLNI